MSELQGRMNINFRVFEHIFASIITVCNAVFLASRFLLPPPQSPRCSSDYSRLGRGTIHKRRRQFFRIFETSLTHVGSFLVLSVSNFDQFLTPPTIPITDVVYGKPRVNKYSSVCNFWPSWLQMSFMDGSNSQLSTIFHLSMCCNVSYSTGSTIAKLQN